MKALFLTAILINGITIATAQPSFQISGQITGLNSGTVSLNYIDKNQTKQLESEIKDGRFKFTGSLPETEYLNLSFKTENGNKELFFFAGNEDVQISIDTAQWDSPEIKGSKSEKEYELYKRLTKSVDEKSNALNRNGSALYASGKLDERTRDSLFSVRDQLDLEKRNIIADFAKANPSSAVSAWAIGIYYSYEPDLAELLPAYQILSKQNQQTIYGKKIVETIQAVKKTAVGNRAPDFTVTDPFGNPVSLHNYNGKFLLVDFWASWCGPCRAENPNVVRVYKKHHSDQFDILGVSLDNNRELWLKAIKKDNLEWKQGSDLKAWDSDIVKDYGLKGIPFNMLLDKNGKIIAKNLRGADLEIKLAEVLDAQDTGRLSSPRR